MKKQAYMKPTMRVVELQHHTHILAGSPGSQASLLMLTGQIDDEGAVW